MPYNFAGQLQYGQPVSSFIGARDNAVKNALFQQQAAEQQANAEANRQNLLFEQNRQTASDQRQAQQDQIAAQARAQSTSQDEGKQIHSAMQALGAVANDPVKFQGLAQRILNHPTLGPALAKHGVTQEDMTPDNVQELLAASGAETGQAPPVTYTTKAGPRGSQIQTDSTGKSTQLIGPDNTESPNYGQARAPMGYRVSASGNLEFIPGGPADPSLAQNPHTLRPIPATAASGFIANKTSIDKIDRAITAVQAYPDAFGLKNALGDTVRQRTDPKGVDPRAKVADIGSLVIHDRSGAAVSASEFPRLKPFIPSPTDKPETVVTKLQNLKANLEAIQEETSAFFSPDAGYRPLAAPAQAAAQGDGQPLRISSPAEAAKLPVGTHFVTPDGQVRVKR